MKGKTAPPTPTANTRLSTMCTVPPPGYFRYYASTWAASVNVQGAKVTSPTDPLQLLVDKWFAFDSFSNVITPPYLEPDLEFDGDFSRCAWYSLYSPITPVQRARSIMRIDLWRHVKNDGCPVLWDDPELIVWADSRPIQHLSLHHHHDHSNTGGGTEGSYHMVNHHVPYHTGGGTPQSPIHPMGGVVSRIPAALVHFSSLQVHLVFHLSSKCQPLLRSVPVPMFLGHAPQQPVVPQRSIPCKPLCIKPCPKPLIAKTPHTKICLSLLVWTQATRLQLWLK
jgi:hypothetical protein